MKAAPPTHHFTPRPIHQHAHPPTPLPSLIHLPTHSPREAAARALCAATTQTQPHWLTHPLAPTGGSRGAAAGALCAVPAAPARVYGPPLLAPACVWGLGHYKPTRGEGVPSQGRAGAGAAVWVIRPAPIWGRRAEHHSTCLPSIRTWDTKQWSTLAACPRALPPAGPGCHRPHGAAAGSRARLTPLRGRHAAAGGHGAPLGGRCSNRRGEAWKLLCMRRKSARWWGHHAGLLKLQAPSRNACKLSAS